LRISELASNSLKECKTRITKIEEKRRAKINYILERSRKEKIEKFESWSPWSSLMPLIYRQRGKFKKPQKIGERVVFRKFRKVAEKTTEKYGRPLEKEEKCGTRLATF